VRLAQTLPPERSVRVRQILEPRMQRIESEMRELGDLARGPGSYALARGSMALGDYERARDLIARAWDSGYTTPEVSYARGVILGHFYQEALLRATSVQDRKEVERTHRTTVLRYLRGANGATLENPAVLEAQIAFNERRWDDAIFAARRASASTPWLWEGKLLEATILRQRAADAADAGDLDNGRRMLDASGSAYAAVLSFARSDALAYVGECQRRIIGMRIDSLARRLTSDDVKDTIAPCEQAIAIDPDLVDAWTAIGGAHTTAIEDQNRHGDDPTRESEVAREALGNALSRNPNAVGALSRLGLVHLTRGRWTFNHGGDPRPDLDEAEKVLRRAAALEPRTATNHNSLGNTRVTRANYDARVGGDPIPDIRKAIEHYKRALELSPAFVPSMTNIGTAYTMLADRTNQIGGDPRADLTEATRWLSRASERSPPNAIQRNNHANAYLARAEYQIKIGGDPADAARHALAISRKAKELRPDYSLPYFNFAYASAMLGDIATARTALARYDELAPGDPDALWLHARVALRAGAIDEAKRYLKEGLAVTPDSEQLKSIAKEIGAR